MEGFDDLLEAKAKELRDLQDKKVLVLQEEIRYRYKTFNWPLSWYYIS